AISLSVWRLFMVNTKRGRFRSAFWRSLGVFLLSVPLGTNAVQISNGVPDGTVGSYRVDVEAGGGTRNVFVTAVRSRDMVTTNVVRNYYGFVDPGINGFGDRFAFLSASAPVPDPINPNSVTSNGFFFGVNRIDWTAVSSIAPGAQVMTTTYTFIAEPGKVLGPLRFLQHLDGFVLEGSDDVFFHTGSAVGGDLKLFTFDNTDVYGISHSGALLPGNDLQNASFAGWAADHFDNITSSILTAGQPVSPDGIIANLSSFQHPQLGPVFGPADNVSVLAWDVAPNATSAVITTSLGGVPISVEAQPVGNLLVGNSLRCRSKKCTFRARCIVSRLGAPCTNQINVTVTKKALGSSGGGPRIGFASGAANVASGQNATVQLRLTKRARNFVRSTTKKTIKGMLEIKSIDGVAVNAFRATISINK
ncbi:MAG: hypothetical protein ACREYC_26525, partial [Gammaproteobacteria bacterium]